MKVNRSESGRHRRAGLGPAAERGKNGNRNGVFLARLLENRHKGNIVNPLH